MKLKTGIVEYMTPYDVYEAECGPYNPDVPIDQPFSVRMSRRKSDYLAEFPDRAKNQIDGNFYSAELTRFFQWISDRRKQ